MATLTYARHFAVLGKLCKLYDDAAAASATQKLLTSAYMDQVADGLAASLAMAIAQSTYAQQFNSALSSGEDTRKTVALNAAKAYLTNAYFTDELTTIPASTSVSAVLAALQTEMGATVDNVTLGTKTTTGLVNFFDAILVDEGGSAGTWNTESDATADYRDAVYVVATIVADP
jgi:hypothetical protein